MKGKIRELYNSYLDESGKNKRKAASLTAKRVQSLLNTDKVKPSDFSFGQLAHELVDDFEGLRSESIQDVALAIESSAFPTISNVVINKEILDSYELYMEDTQKLVSELQATRTNREYIVGFSDTEQPELRLEGMSYQDTQFGEREVEIVMADFGRTISVTAETLFNDRTGQILNKARSIGEKGGQHRAQMIIQTLEVAARTAFKEASSASKAFVYNGTAVQAAAFYNATGHAAVDGRVNANLVTSNALADYTDIEAAVRKFDSMVDFAGDKIAVRPQYVIVPTALETTAWQILNSDTFFKDPSNAGTGIYHQPNPYGGSRPMKSFIPFTSRYLSSSTAWYIGDPAKQLTWLWVYKPATDSLAASTEKAFYNKIVVTYKFSYHGGCGHRDYVNIVKSTA